MSRIHEALKKAEQERSAMPAPEPILQSHEQVSSASAWTATAATLAPEPRPTVVPEAAPQVSAAQVEYLRFDDLRARCSHPRWTPDPNVNVFLNSALSPHGAEQFRTLRSRLYQLRSNQPLRTLLITSSVPAEGKTFVTNNLAQAIVRQPDRRVLIIDADLRCSRLHVPLGAPDTPGLADYLRGDADEMAIIQHGQEGGLCFIPGGTEGANPSELLSNGRLKKLLDRLTPMFDWVLLDSPPCVPVADASILAEHCDGVLLVVRAGSTPVEVAQRACQELDGRNVVGVVFNAATEPSLYGSHYYQAYGQPVGD
ncbi:MAG TPA: CpsD/CapB family tyrosine-protein kinase [Candidatus Baltobacteraceae bacterium]|nr:CpsD/CapB family tyrosine-protein kinase [Candidatus Baltobacteraceae bacterium]